MYLAPSNANALRGDILEPSDIDARVAGMHPTMQAEGGRLLRARDQAARLMTGTGDFAALWGAPGGLYDPGQIDIHAETIAGVCAVTDMAPYPAAAVLEHLSAMAAIDAAHPMVAQRELLRDACTPMDLPAPDWSALDADIASRAVLAAGPRIGQLCDFYPADGSAPREGVVTYVWNTAMVNLAFTENGGPASATSVSVLQTPSPDIRYYCVLRA